MSNYRQLLDKEIATLTVYGCSAENWKSVLVVENFSPSYFSNVHFSGNIKLGTYNHVFNLPGGFSKHAGIFNCSLHNCEIGNDVYINNIHNYVANYKIEDYCFIENVDALIVDGISSFGNGIEVPVLNEAGGREVPIFDFLSSSMAYIICMYRHRPQLIQQFKNQIGVYTSAISSGMGTIAKNAIITNAGSIKNVKVGAFTKIEGALQLSNGTINSTEQAPVYIGAGVQCSNFIICSGSKIAEAATISGSFIGQSVLVGKQYSVVDSLFFANSQGLHGEATAVFAGPYTVTHHKSTLLIAGMFSFYNAGSGTNQSNHLYKLGPVHQGVTARGCKAASDSYVLWPANIGAFTLIQGRHYGHSDIADLPFSYLMENNGESYLLPALNLRSVGTLRDAQKWKQRDERKDLNKLDLLNFEMLNPFTISKILKGKVILNKLLSNEQLINGYYRYQNCNIKESAVKNGIKLYELAIQSYAGTVLANRLEKSGINIIDKNSSYINNKDIENVDEWVDLSGLIAPKDRIDSLLNNIETGDFDLVDIQEELKSIYQSYDEMEFAWLLSVLKMNKITQNEAVEILNNAIEAKKQLLELVFDDAKKEFAGFTKVGYGIDDAKAVKEADFTNVRGSFEANTFIKDLIKQNEEFSEKAQKLIAEF